MELLIEIMSDKYTVLHVMLNTGKGGMEEVFRQYNLALSDFCNIISVIDENCQNKEIVTEGSSEVIELNKKFGTLSAILHMRKIAKKHKIDCIIVHDSPGLSITNLAMIGFGIKKISVRHTFFSSVFSKFRWKMKSDVQIVVNKQLALEIGNKNTYVVYNSVGYDLKDNIKKRDLGNTVKIGFLGRVVHNKGAQFLVKALGLLVNKKKLNCQVVVAGDGRYLKALKHLTFLYGLNDKVTFLGYVNDKDEFFNEVDIFCLPSLKETFGLVLLESMAHAIPVVASNIPGIDEVVIDGENGILFSPGDHHDLADKIENLINDSYMRNTIVDEALNRVEQSYSVDRLRGDLQNIISSIK
jgi:glycosyltransferase involved in cell wall biosynthesis